MANDWKNNVLPVSTDAMVKTPKHFTINSLLYNCKLHFAKQ